MFMFCFQFNAKGVAWITYSGHLTRLNMTVPHHTTPALWWTLNRIWNYGSDKGNIKEP